MKKIVTRTIGIFMLGLMFLGCESEPTKESEWKSFKLSIAEDRIKERLRDPGSFERIGYNVNYKDDKISSITIEYTAKNGFGGTNRERQTISF